MHNQYHDDIKRRMEAYKAEQEAYERSDNLELLNRRVINLSFANSQLYRELTSQKRLTETLIARLNNMNEPPKTEEYSSDDLRMFKSMGISV